MTSRLVFSVQPIGNRRTYTWLVTNSAKLQLGMVRWYGPWRRYCLLTNSLMYLDAECLREIADFCGTQTLARRAERKLESIGL